MHATMPTYLLGGGMKSGAGDPLFGEIFAFSGKKHPSIAYVGAASRDNKEFFGMIAGRLKDLGAAGVTLVPTAGKRFDPGRAEETLSSSDIVFISGGDVEYGMQVLQDRGLTVRLARLHADGKLFFGVSAGSIMLCRQWVRWRDPDDDATAEIFPCLGLCPILCDTHAEDDDWVELKALLRLCPDGTAGYGIPSGGAVRVAPDGTVTRRGAGAVRFVKSGSGVIEVDKAG